MRRTKFDARLSEIGKARNSFADIVNEAMPITEYMVAEDIDKPSEGGVSESGSSEKLPLVLKWKLTCHMHIQCDDEEKERIRHRMQNIMNTMCGRLPEAGRLMPDVWIPWLFP